MAVVPLELWSLPAAMALLAQRPGPGEVVVTRAVSVNQAGALLTILEQKAEKREWIVLEMDRLHAVVRVQQLLSAAIDAYLPYLADRPFDHAYLDLLRDWSRDLENTAALVDHRYSRKMKATGRKVRKFVVKSRKAAFRVPGHRHPLEEPRDHRPGQSPQGLRGADPSPSDAGG